MRRIVVITVLCVLGMVAAWHYALTLEMLITQRFWLMAGLVVVGCAITSM